jgi:5'-3' exoribonuclease 1
MKDFVNTYKEDASEAKRTYYLKKLNFDVKDTKGKKDLHKMLFRYLEGLQWVLFYYYRGA